MCGIAGGLTNKSLSKTEIGILRQGIEQRGPDASGTITEKFIDGSLTFIHTRFSVVAVGDKNANQPFKVNGDILVFNGEIYNHNELRDSLVREFSVEFETVSDTEVLAWGLHHLGYKFLDKVNGFWSLCYYSKKNNVVALSRDRLGKKPLYFTKNHEDFLFSSDQNSLVKLLKSENVLNIGAVSKFLLNDFGCNSVDTYHVNVRQIPPGVWYEINLNTKRIDEKRLNSIQLSITNHYQTSENQERIQHEFSDLLIKAVDCRWSDEVAVSINLSGGLDSMAILGALKELNKSTFTCHTLQFDGVSDFDVQKSKSVCDFYGFKHDLINYSSKEIFERSKHYLESSSFPVHSPVVAAQKDFWSKIGSENFRVILHGSGNDEFSYGYQYYLQLYQLSLLKNYQFVEFFKFNDKGNFNALLRLIKWKIFGLDIRRDQSKHCKKFFDDDFYPLMKTKAYRTEDINTSLKKRRILDIDELRIPYWNMLMDQSSMQVPIEIRMPFYDKNIIKYYLEQDEGYFFNSGRTKNHLREFLNRSMPDIDFNEKKKIGFRSPDKKIVIENYEEIETEINENNLFSIKLPPKNKKLSTQDYNLIWRLFSLSYWSRYHDMKSFD